LGAQALRARTQLQLKDKIPFLVSLAAEGRAKPKKEFYVFKLSG